MWRTLAWKWTPNRIMNRMMGSTPITQCSPRVKAGAVRRAEPVLSCFLTHLILFLRKTKCLEKNEEKHGRKENPERKIKEKPLWHFWRLHRRILSRYRKNNLQIRLSKRHELEKLYHVDAKCYLIEVLFIHDGNRKIQWCCLFIDIKQNIFSKKSQV